MARSYTQVAPDSTGDKISTDEKIDGLGNTVQEQIIRLAGAAIDEVADVRNTTPGASDMGMVVRAVGGGDVTALTASTGDVADAAATAGAVGTIQAKLRLMTSQLASILTSVDGLEGFTDGLEGLITSLGALVDGLEASIGTTADAAAVAGDVGTIQAKLRIATSLFNEIDVAIVALQGLVGITSAAASAVGGEGNLTAKLRLMTSQLDAITTGISLTITRLTEIRDSGRLVTVAFDYLSQALTATTDTWTYKSGGAGGTTVATVTVTYVDSTKAAILSVART